MTFAVEPERSCLPKSNAGRNDGMVARWTDEHCDLCAGIRILHCVSNFFFFFFCMQRSFATFFWYKSGGETRSKGTQTFARCTTHKISSHHDRDSNSGIQTSVSIFCEDGLVVNEI